MTLLDVDVDTRFHEIVDDIEVCDVEDCDRLARWLNSCSTCHQVLHACTEHRAELDTYFEHMTRRFPGGYVKCKFCSNELPFPLQWQPI